MCSINRRVCSLIFYDFVRPELNDQSDDHVFMYVYIAVTVIPGPIRVNRIQAGLCFPEFGALHCPLVNTCVI